MGVELLEIGYRQIRKVTILSIRACHRSVRNHPFLAGMLFLLVLVYRLFPVMFFLLVSVSPVLVSTAILLGTLLSFGQPNIPETEKDYEKTTTQNENIYSLKTTGSSRDVILVERSENYIFARDSDKQRDVNDNPGEVNRGNSFVDNGMLLFEPREMEICKQHQGIKEGEMESHDSGFKQRRGMNEVQLGDGEVVVENHAYFPIQNEGDENLEFGIDKSAVAGEDIIDSPGTDYLGPSAGSSTWKHAEDGAEEDDDEASTDGSSRAESSSPDASMADIIPMLDELHPLLDEDAPQPAQLSHDGSQSDADSECSPKSHDGGDNSDENTDNQDELVTGDDEIDGDDDYDDDDDDDDDDEGEEMQGDKADVTKTAITWTEDDQKNLMDLGTSELERNQRLESLIARRRARKNIRIMAERNLIDIEGVDLPFNSIAPISTTRHNPFDLPGDSCDMELPPIPGSAPSILRPRRNPFDLPYDPSEEKPDLMADSFQQEFMSFQSREAIFRRHESFNVGPSFFGIFRQQKQDSKLRPYFVPERIASEGTSYSPFQRQSSELSDSKVSSVPETESIGSAVDLEDKKLIEEEFTLKEELISDLEHSSEHVGHGSQSSLDVDSVELGQVENKDIELDEIETKFGDEQNHGLEASLSERETLACPLEHTTNDYTVALEQRYSSGSSSSPFSEVNEKIINEEEGEVTSSSEPSKANLTKKPSISKQPSLEQSVVCVTSGSVGYTQLKEPVYDSSPTAVTKSLSSSSTFSDLQVEISGIKRTISFSERTSEVSNQSEKNDTPGDEEMLTNSSQPLALDKTDWQSTGVTVTGEPEVVQFGFSEVNLSTESPSTLIMPESVVKHAFSDPKPFSGSPPENDEVLTDSPQPLPLGKTDGQSTRTTETCGPEVVQIGFSEVNPNTDSEHTLIMPESVAKQSSSDPTPFSETPVGEDLMYQNDQHHHNESEGAVGKLPILEALSLEDFNSVFKQMNDAVVFEQMNEAAEKPIVIESILDELTSEENMDEFVERVVLRGSDGDGPDGAESKYPAETFSESHDVKIRSSVEMNASAMQVSEVNIDKQPTSNSEDGFGKFANIEWSSSNDAESSIKESGVQDTSSGPDVKPDHDAEMSEDFSSSISDVKAKDPNSPKLSSPKDGESSNNESGVQENSSAAVVKSGHGVEMSKDFSLSISESDVIVKEPDSKNFSSSNNAESHIKESGAKEISIRAIVKTDHGVETSEDTSSSISDSDVQVKEVDSLKLSSSESSIKEFGEQEISSGIVVKSEHGAGMSEDLSSSMSNVAFKELDYPKLSSSNDGESSVKESGEQEISSGALVKSDHGVEMSKDFSPSISGVEVKELDSPNLSSFKDGDSSIKESGEQEISSGAVVKSDHGVDMSEDFRSSISDVEVKELDSPKFSSSNDGEAGIKECGVHEISSGAVVKSDHGVEMSEDFNSSISESDIKDKEQDSHKLSSSSSSSPSDT